MGCRGSCQAVLGSMKLSRPWMTHLFMEAAHNLSRDSLSCWTAVPNWSIEGSISNGGEENGKIIFAKRQRHPSGKKQGELGTTIVTRWGNHMDHDIDNEEELELEQLEIEEVTLDKVDEDGEILSLVDGRRLLVNPDDISIAVAWLPPSTLEVIETNEEEDGLFNLSILLKETDQEVRA